MTDADGGLEYFGDYFEEMLADIQPAKRKLVARKIGQRLRRANLVRIADNVQPDGSKMEPRKERRDRRGRIRVRAGTKMFKKLRYARNFNIRASSDGVEIGPQGGIERTSRIHHYGLMGYVGKNRDGEAIRVRYPRRRLLGFSEDDIDGMTEELLEWLDRD